ncbi:MAG: PIG-L family deacetylase [Coxiellaceae bacterium]|nr:PIG-L family deacetylase [Coxiellaceae bacterium]
MKKKILIIAPHPDDEILGVGGSAAKYAAIGYDVTVLTIAGHRPPLYSEDIYQQTVKESKLAHKKANIKRSIFLDFPATTLKEIPTYQFNAKICDIVYEIEPNIVFCPYPDRHIDHRIVFESAMVATRPIKKGKFIDMIAAYETLSETHWNAPHIESNFVPNWIIDITGYIDVKIASLECYQSQISPFPNPRSIEAIIALSKFRGTQAGFAYGEAFQIIRKCS